MTNLEAWFLAAIGALALALVLLPILRPSPPRADTLTPCERTAVAAFGRIDLLNASDAHEAIETRCRVPGSP